MLPPKEFIRKIRPFSFLSEDELNSIMAGLEVGLFKKGTVIYRKGEPMQYIYVIYSGLVGLFDDETAVDYISRGEVFGIMPLSGYPSILTSKALEDTICYWVPAVDFRKVFERNERFSSFFTTFLSRRFRSFRAIATDGKISEETALVLHVESLLYKKPVVCEPDLTIQQAVAIMDRNRVSSIVVVDREMKPAGILTHKDLRRIIVQSAIHGTISDHMSTPVKTVTVRTTVLDTLIEMIHAGMGHLVVLDDGKVVGVVTRKDIQMQLEPSSSIVSLYGRIVKASSLSELEVIFKRIKTSVAKVALTGLGFYHLSGLISSTYDALTTKVIEIRREGRSTGPFTWLHMGSSGRKEQIIATDQDSAMICGADDLVPFARDVTETLNRIGMPNCPGDYMASNPKWNQTISAWKQHIHDWFNNPIPDHVRYLSIFLDLRPVYGDESVHRELVEFMKANITRKAIELLAYDAIELEPPLGIFGIIGLHKGVDLKTYGIYPIVNGVRVLALENGMLETTNTKERLELLRQRGAISDNLCNDLIESYGFIQDIRTRHYSTAVLSHSPEDNLIRGKEIDKVDLLLLKESLKIVASFQRFLMARYRIKRSGGIL